MSIVLTGLLAVGLAVSAVEHAGKNGHASSAAGLIADVRSYLRDPLAYLALRSPGARGSGELIQSKHPIVKSASQGVKPHERVLADSRLPAPLANNFSDLAQVSPGLFEAGAAPFLGGPGPIGGFAIASVVPGAGSGAGGIGGGVGVGGASDGGSGNTTGSAVVPEPSTWLMLIWGIALVGLAGRRNSRHVHRVKAKSWSAPPMR